VGLMWTRGWRIALVLLVACAMPIVAVTVRNYIVSRQFVMIASHGGLNFYIGNNADADGTYHHVEGVRPTILGQAEDAQKVEARQGSFYGRRSEERRVGKEWRARRARER